MNCYRCDHPLASGGVSYFEAWMHETDGVKPMRMDLCKACSYQVLAFIQDGRTAIAKARWLAGNTVKENYA